MIVCIIEFGVRPGAEELRDELVADLMKAVVKIDGFISKETFISRDKPGKMETLSYWRDQDSLRAWMRDPAHMRTVSVGKRSVFSHYHIQVATIARDVQWTAPPADPQP